MSHNLTLTLRNSAIRVSKQLQIGEWVDLQRIKSLLLSDLSSGLPHCELGQESEAETECLSYLLRVPHRVVNQHDYINKSCNHGLVWELGSYNKICPLCIGIWYLMTWSFFFYKLSLFFSRHMNYPNLFYPTLPLFPRQNIREEGWNGKVYK